VLFEISDGTFNNRFAITRLANSSNLRLRPVIGGTLQPNADAAYTPGAMTAFGLTINGAGRAALSVAGTVPVVATGGPTSGLTTAGFATQAGSPGLFFGAIQRIQVIPRAISDAELQARVANF
jgi:hypothetical protein